MVLPPGHLREVMSKRPLSRREKWTLGMVVGATAVLAIVLIIALIGPAQTTAPGCVDVSIVGVTGGAAIHQCGANARELCRTAGTAPGAVRETRREIQAACRKDGFALR
jgi:hypothetical protein